MGKIACFVEKYNFSDHREEAALENFKHAAQKLGHRFEFLFRQDISEIPKYDALFIRATTDPLFTAYVASKTAQELGLRVIDDPESICICSNKIHQYELFKRYEVPHIPTIFITKDEFHHSQIKRVFEKLGKPVVIKGPSTCFSRYVEKAACETSFREIAKRFFRKI